MACVFACHKHHQAAKCYFDTPHRARAAFFPIALSFFFPSFFARAGPPFNPPSRPSATAAGFLPAVSAALSGGVGISAPGSCVALTWFRMLNAI